MRALLLRPGQHSLSLEDQPEIRLSEDHQIKMRVLRVGVCGTDRDEVREGRAVPPTGRDSMVLGHELLAEVVDCGPAVTKASPGDLGTFTVRRSCDRCSACAQGRCDLCATGDYRERGIKAADGYQSEFVIDDEAYFVPVSSDLRLIGELVEPMSIVQKGLAEAAAVRRARIPFEPSAPAFARKRVLVVGLGAVGLLAAVSLRLQASTVYGLDIVAPTSKRPRTLEAIGGSYLHGKDESKARDNFRGFDFIFEATGVAKVEFELFDMLAPNGVYVALGVPTGERMLQLDGAAIFRNLVLENQTLVGSVNASLEHFEAGMRSLSQASQQWPGLLERFITRRFSPPRAEEALEQRGEDDIKTVIEWQGSGVTTTS
jgi:threonine dehydrogenase-like Zn-dependent dehydrogenase